jgi:hypothetical protein
MWILKDTINELKDTYNSLDLRAILFYSVDNRDWFSGFLMITFTNKSKKDVLQEHKVLMQNSDVPNEADLKVVMECQPISDIDRIISEIDNMRISIGGITARLPTTLSQGLSREKFQVYEDGANHFKAKGMEKDYSYRLFTVVRNVFAGPFKSMFELNKVDLNKYNIEVEDLSNYFDLDYIPDNDCIMMVFPIYMKQVTLDQNNNIIDGYAFHKTLYDSLKFRVSASIDGSNFTKEREIEIIDEKDPWQVAKLTFDKKIENDNSFRIKISHAGLGTIKEYEIKGEEINRRISTVKSGESEIGSRLDLLSMVKNFGWYNLLVENLKSALEGKHVQSVTQLLTLLGYPSINLGTFGKNGEQIIENVGSPAADIISYVTDSDRIYLIDCTITIPDETKINKIRNAAKILNSRIGTEIIPVIVSEQLVTSRENANNAGVIIIDGNQIEALVNLLNQESLDKARESLDSYFG